VIRAALRVDLVAGTEWVRQLIMGEPVVDDFDPKTGVTFKRPGTADERMRAMEFNAKFGLGTKIDVTSDDLPIKAWVNIDDDRV
jgi:hypothetical protein